jgi:hypothetical protein
MFWLWAINSAVECHLHTVEATGSIPVSPTKTSLIDEDRTILGRIMKKSILISFVPLWLSLQFAHAQEESADFTLICGKKGVSLEFKSASGDFTADDMSIFVKSLGTIKKLPIKSGWFHRTSQASTMASACTSQDQENTAYPAFFINDSLLALFIVRDGRPGYSTLELAFIQLETKELLDIQVLGLMKTAFPVIQAYHNGYKVRVVRETNVANCDCAEAYVDAWKAIEVQHNKIVSQWLEY